MNVVTLDSETVRQNKSEALRIANEYVKNFVAARKHVNPDFIESVREGVYTGALTALNSLSVEIKYLRTGGNL